MMLFILWYSHKMYGLTSSKVKLIYGALFMKKHPAIIIMLIFMLLACKQNEEAPNLIPVHAGTAPNYWCTWYWQNYLILKGQEVVNPDPAAVYTNAAARDELNEETIFGKNGMARLILPRSRGDYYFLIDHGWQDKRIEKQTFFTFVMDTLDFPRYAHLAPKDRIRQMNIDIKALGWKGLGLWVRGNPSKAAMRKFIEWNKYAGIEYWKIDGGDTRHFYATRLKDEIYPELTLEHVTGAGPLTPNWNEPGLSVYPSVYDPDTNTDKSKMALEVIQHTDVFRTYDAAPLLVSTTTLQRIHNILSQTAGKAEYRAILNIQDDCNIAAALGLLVAVKRHPMNTPRLYQGKDYHLQIAGDRHVENRLDEMDRLAMWQRIAPPMPAGYGTYHFSENQLIDSIRFQKSDTWLKATHGKMVRQSAPAIMTRNISMPEVLTEGPAPYVLASKFPNGAVCIATEGRVMPGNSWFHPRADITLEEVEVDQPTGIFGHYKSLTLAFKRPLPKDLKIYAQDLLAKHATDITGEVTIGPGKIRIPGDLIDKIGTSARSPGDISVPGLVIRVRVD